ncbi:sugar ABC transporter substrate-binding protein [Agarivorans sp. MS3-6]|uniref:sugar ABC transporter substrate-binding protein n=1 Tax=Agarivorans sp. TSD2052 TaxID=2937286 RepID=UPI0020105761|nr:extracellular solute-binding protein [Agarivorans sp. TSD2052]UPW19921.1 extracellular solute-binding protein [Agarivorans sp. TSD2052]
MRVCLLLIFFCCSKLSAEQLSFMYYREQGKAAFSELLDEFSKQYNHQVTIYTITSDSLKPTLIKSVMQGQSADVVFAPSDVIGIARQAKFSEVPETLISSDMSKELLLTASIDQKIYGIPILQGNHLMLFYNRRFVGKPAKTWQELLEQQPVIEKQGVATIGWNYSEMYWFAGFYNTFGGRMTRGKKVTLNEPAMHDALNFYRNIATRNLVSADCAYDCGYRDFIEGKVAYAINGEWAIDDFEKQLDDDLGIAVIPSIGERPFRPLSSSLVLVFPNQSLSSAKAAALRQLSEFLQTPEVQLRLHTQARFLPANSALIQQIKQQSTSNEQAILSQLELAVPMSAEAAQASAWVGMRKGFELFNKGLVDAEKASGYMQQYADRDYGQQAK